ncbi:MAG TPA: hypothetical protein VFA83_11885 [Acidimicrobiales bacterium]|nr:hypothetical protein [Acidimicrobiales bacterium]
MPVFLGAFPVLPGKADEVRKFAQETLGRGEEFSASQRASGVSREEWSLQETPMGDLVLVRFEADDIEKSFERLATSTDDFDVWFRSRVMDISGVDLAAPPDGPPPEIILDWRA